MAAALIPTLATNFTTLISVFGAASQIRAFPECTREPLKSVGICDTSASNLERSTSLVNLFTLEEKIQAVTLYIPGIERLGVPSYTLWNEALHGLGTSIGLNFARSGNFSAATSFPQPIVLGAAFDDSLVYEVATAISIEGRAFGNVGRAGLDYWTPNVNPFRDPRWGRGKETPGEDPFRVSAYTKAFVAGLEGPHSSRTKRGVATCKHYAAYDLENYQNVTRFTFDALVNVQDLAEYYTPPFKACTRDANAGSIMCSYNSVNGIPSCLDPWLLQTVLREHWGWESDDHYITTDCFGLDAAYMEHNYTSTPEETAALALKAGTDNDCGIFFPTYLPSALSKGLISETDLDRALIRVFAALVRLGYYDPPESQPYRAISHDSVNTAVTQKLARKAATSGMVLLKNKRNTLPLPIPTKGVQLSVALVGDWANATTDMLGGYSGPAPFLHSPLYGLQRIPGITVNMVVEINDPAPALEAAKSSDIVLYIGGIDEHVESEGLDRTVLTWNSTQKSLITSLAKLGKKMVLAQSGGGQLDDSEFLANPNISSILWIGYPGQDGGVALADILFGRVAPAGRLPISQYPADYVSLPATDMNLRPDGKSNPGRTYKWYNKAVLPFGFGLHYTTFRAKASLENDGLKDLGEIVKRCRGVQRLDLCEFGHIVVDIRNTGKVKSDYSALAFASGHYGPLPRPIKELVAYTRLHDIEPGKTQRVRLPITLGSLARWDKQGRNVLFPGLYRIAIDTTPELAWVTFALVGKPQALEIFPKRPV
ncbi:glycoside hydrolase family 3 protein [Cadophora sp. DSE1049]|nr:glycoside hydrolase family 3 protein [Cadophora sp. DSE1049]